MTQLSGRRQWVIARTGRAESRWDRVGNRDCEDALNASRRSHSRNNRGSWLAYNKFHCHLVIDLLAGAKNQGHCAPKNKKVRNATTKMRIIYRTGKWYSTLNWLTFQVIPVHRCHTEKEYHGHYWYYQRCASTRIRKKSVIFAKKKGV